MFHIPPYTLPKYLVSDISSRQPPGPGRDVARTSSDPSQSAISGRLVAHLAARRARQEVDLARLVVHAGALLASPRLPKVVERWWLRGPQAARRLLSSGGARGAACSIDSDAHALGWERCEAGSAWLGEAGFASWLGRAGSVSAEISGSDTSLDSTWCSHRTPAHHHSIPTRSGCASDSRLF